MKSSLVLGSRYILRFDDICSTMNWAVWDRVESTLLRLGIRPIVAVVPDNQDPFLQVAPARADFWERVRTWNRRGWAIAVHGFQHVYSTSDAGLVGINRRSEFAGLPRSVQGSRLDAALRIFRGEGLIPRIWVAPGHSFDAITVECLLERGVTVISDGFTHRPVRRLGCTWLPQQLWRFRHLPFGTWTVCLHVNSWGAREVEAFEADVELFRSRIVDVENVLERRAADADFTDRIFSGVFRSLVLGKRLIGSRSAVS